MTQDCSQTGGGTPFRVVRASRCELAALRQIASEKISSEVATLETFLRVAEKNEDSHWAIKSNSGCVKGFVSFLMLNQLGLECLLNGDLDTKSPDIKALAETGEVPAGVYTWAIVAEGKMAALLTEIFAQFDPDVYAKADLLGKPVTNAGLKLMRRVGFRAIDDGELTMGQLGVIRRSHGYVRVAYQKDFALA